MVKLPALLSCKIFHKRYFPKVNQFTYNSFYLLIPIDKLKELGNKILMRLGRFGIFSFCSQDHSVTDNVNNDLRQDIEIILNANGVKIEGLSVTLMAMPRVLGYVFNPVSFWFCRNNDNNLMAVLAEVRNTYGEKHCYLCFKDNMTAITKSDTMVAKKVFHVSPFIKREGKYQFRFELLNDAININIDLYDDNNEKLLTTSVQGKIAVYSNRNLLYYFVYYPFITVKTIGLIHWQALKLFFKGIKFLNKPDQHKTKITKATDKL